MFTARYGLSPYITQILFVLRELIPALQFYSIKFNFINVPSQQPGDKLQKQHNIEAQIRNIEVFIPSKTQQIERQ